VGGGGKVVNGMRGRLDKVGDCKNVKKTKKMEEVVCYAQKDKIHKSPPTHIPTILNSVNFLASFLHIIAKICL
jgi:hypothetical protein